MVDIRPDRMTPQQAADEVERVMARTMPLRNQEHLRVLIDHARATSPAPSVAAPPQEETGR